MNIIFFGTPDVATIVLDTLVEHDMVPSLIITAPDKPSGRGLTLEASPVAVWAQAHNIECYKPTNLKTDEVVTKIAQAQADVAVVFAYGKIIPASILSLPKYGMVNIHPSLLPLHRGPAPVEGALLAGDNETGVSVMLLDDQMDHGPILVQEKVQIEATSTAHELLQNLVRRGAENLVKILPDFIAGTIKKTEQDHTKATYTKKISKADGEILLSDIEKNPASVFAKFRAYADWPTIYYFEPGGARIIITKAHMHDGVCSIDMVKPEGKRDMPYADYIRNKK